MQLVRHCNTLQHTRHVSHTRLATWQDTDRYQHFLVCRISLIVSATTQTKERRCWKFCSVGVYATRLPTKRAKSKSKTQFASVCVYNNMYITFTVAIFFGGGRYWPYSAAPPVYLNSFAPGRFTRACKLGRFRQCDNCGWVKSTLCSRIYLHYNTLPYIYGNSIMYPTFIGHIKTLPRRVFLLNHPTSYTPLFCQYTSLCISSGQWSDPVGARQLRASHAAASRYRAPR